MSPPLQHAPSTRFLLLECIGIFVALPLLMLGLGLQKFLLPGLWIVALYTVWQQRRQGTVSLREAWRAQAVTSTALRPILTRFCVSAAAITLFTYNYTPENFLGFVRQMPWFWAVVMLLYPLLSVVAQEMIYRWFFFDRYATLFPTPKHMIVANGLAFGFGHVMFGNWVSPLFCVIGGLFFAQTYQRHRSLALVALEHALYGDLVFTIGLGWYFYHGASH